MNEVFIACTIVWLPFIVLGLCAFVQYLRLKPERDKMEVINPFKESDKLIEHAKESYFEMKTWLLKTIYLFLHKVQLY